MRGNLLESALKAHNEWHPQPIWSNFLGLFRYVDKGNHDMDIPPYNGGLFAEDPLVDALMLPEDLAKDVASLGAWDYRREVPVTVLGHIFEQSITDIERKKAEAGGMEPPKVSARKRNRRRLHARHGHPLFGRADRRTHARRAARRSARGARGRGGRDSRRQGDRLLAGLARGSEDSHHRRSSLRLRRLSHRRLRPTGAGIPPGARTSRQNSGRRRASTPSTRS